MAVLRAFSAAPDMRHMPNVACAGSTATQANIQYPNFICLLTSRQANISGANVVQKQYPLPLPAGGNSIQHHASSSSSSSSSLTAPRMLRPTYRYKPIDLDKTAIRLLHLLPGHYDCPVYCEIQDVLLGSQGVPYHALSYTWGPNTFHESIHVVDPLDATIQVIHVTKSLFSALRHLRHPVQSMWLWADGVCIDQNNPKERAHQVSQMKQVYSEAERVVIWLGDFASVDPDDTTPSDVDVLMRYARRLDQKVVSGHTPPLEPTSWQDQLLREGANAWSVAKMTSAMHTLLRNPWFRRVWIIQEVVSARSAVVVCGVDGYANSIPTRTFALLPSLLGIKPDIQSQSILDVMPLLGRKRSGDWIHGVNLQTLLVKFQNSQCSEPRDFIFALLGMAADGRNIAPNYEIREEAVFANVLSYFIFGKQVDPTECPLPNNKDMLIEALTNPFGLRIHVLMWALTYGHRATAMRILDLEDEHVDTERSVEASPPISLSNTITATIRPASKAAAKPIKLPPMEKKSWSAALHLATARGGIHLVRRILARPNVNINAKNGAGDSPLSIAVIRRDTDMVRFLLALNKGKGIDVNTTNKEKETPLYIIVSRRDIMMARVLLTHKDVKINYGDTGCDPLARAVAGGDWAMAQLLLQYGADLYPRHAAKPSPLMTAVSSNNATAVRVLLRHSRAGPPVPSNDGGDLRAEVLAAAIRLGNEEIARLLLTHRNAPDLATSDATKLWIQANSEGHERIADLLVEYNYSVDMSGRQGTEALMDAVKLGQLTTVDRLLELEADVNQEILDSMPNIPTPLIRAIASHNVDMARKLIECGADVKYEPRRFCYDFYPLCYAAQRGSLEILDLLLQYEHGDIHAVGALALHESVSRGYKRIFERLWEHQPLDVDVNRNYYGEGPLLTVAAGRGRLSIAKTIVAGARGTVDLNRADLAGNYTPLKQAARAGQTAFAEWLLQIGGNDIDLEFGQDRKGGTALWIAGETLSYEIAAMLLQRGAKPDVECYGSTDDHGPAYLATPLWRAAYKGSARMAAVLLAGGASIHGKGRAERQSLHNPAVSRPHSPLTQAAYRGHAEIVRLLVQHGADPAEVDDEIDDAELGRKLRGFIRKAVEDETVLS